MTDYPSLPRYELRCGPGVIMWLRLTTPEAEPAPPWSGAISALTGVPVIESPELGRGDWEIRKDGEIDASGHIDVPEFVTRPIELPPRDFPDFTSRWLAAGVVTPPSPLTIVTGI